MVFLKKSSFRNTSWYFHRLKFTISGICFKISSSRIGGSRWGFKWNKHWLLVDRCYSWKIGAWQFHSFQILVFHKYSAIRIYWSCVSCLLGNSLWDGQNFLSSALGSHHRWGSEGSRTRQQKKDSLDPTGSSGGRMALQSGPQSGPEIWAFLSSLIQALDTDITWAKEYYLWTRQQSSPA